MPHVTIIVDGTTVADRDVDSINCVACVDGTMELNATFPPIEPDWPEEAGSPDGIIRLV
jgi:hypothetical protein